MSLHFTLKTHIRLKLRYISELRSIGPKINSKRFNIPLNLIGHLKTELSRKNPNFHRNYETAPTKAHFGQPAGNFCKIHHKSILSHFEPKPTGKRL